MTEHVRIKVGWLIDGLSDEALQDAALLILDGTIIDVGPDSIVPTPPGSRLVGLPTATALPGLIDSHVHLTLSADADPIGRLVAESDEDLVVRGCMNAERLLRGGVTTAFDRGARNDTIFAIRDALQRDLALGPRLLVSGRPITPTGGHTHHMHGEADGAAMVRRTVDALAERGVDGIKIVATGGMLTPGSNPAVSTYPTAVLKAAVSQAHRHDLKITAHAHGIEGMGRCVNAGVDSIEHATMLDPRGRWAFDANLARRMADRGVVAVPGVADSLDNSQRLRAEGVRLVAGTDVGVDGTAWGSEMLRELIALVTIGLTPIAAIRAATSHAAEHLGLTRVGALAKGNVADVLIVDGQAATDISAIARPRLVVASGRFVQPTPPGTTDPPVSLAAAGF